MGLHDRPVPLRRARRSRALTVEISMSAPLAEAIRASAVMSHLAVHMGAEPPNALGSPATSQGGLR